MSPRKWLLWRSPRCHTLCCSQVRNPQVFLSIRSLQVHTFSEGPALAHVCCHFRIVWAKGQVCPWENLGSTLPPWDCRVLCMLPIGNKTSWNRAERPKSWESFASYSFDQLFQVAMYLSSRVISKNLTSAMGAQHRATLPWLHRAPGRMCLEAYGLIMSPEDIISITDFLSPQHVTFPTPLQYQQASVLMNFNRLP